MSIVLNCIVLLVLLLISNSILTTHSCPCGDFLPRPDLWKKALTARWMSHSLDWGVLTTFSSRINTNDDGMPSMPPMPFGNVYSFIDGSCINATGTPYFYGTYMDQSFQDMKMNPYASLTLSEASLASTCLDTSSDVFVQKACVISNYPSSTNQTTSDDETYPGDPENPLCARLTLSGKLIEIHNSTMEYDWIKLAFYERHPQMQYWPTNHDWKIVKLNVTEAWIIDYFGGATILSPEQYYEHDLLQIATDGY